MIRKPYDYLTSYRPIYQVKAKPDMVFNDPTKKKPSYLDYYRTNLQDSNKMGHYASVDKKIAPSKSITKLKEEEQRRRRIYSIDISPPPKEDDSQALRKRLQAKIQQLKRKHKPDTARHQPYQNKAIQKTVLKKSEDNNGGLAAMYARLQETILTIRVQEEHWQEQRRRMEDEIDHLSKRLLKHELRYVA